MKFKSIFIVFNLLLLLFLGILIFLPHLVLGSAFATLWTSWPLILVWTVFFLVFNAFYFSNRRLFLLLEKEDWPALARYLEDKVIRKNKYSRRLVRLLANTYLVLSDFAAVMMLENKVALVKPALVDQNTLVFGTARILGRDISGAIHFFAARKDRVKSGIKEWVYWYHGFSLLLDRHFEEAGKEFSLLARVSNDAVIIALSSFFLSETVISILGENAKDFQEIANSGRERVRKALPTLNNWNREISQLSTEIHAAAISKYLKEAANWLYS